MILFRLSRSGQLKLESQALNQGPQAGERRRNDQNRELRRQSRGEVGRTTSGVEPPPDRAQRTGPPFHSHRRDPLLGRGPEFGRPVVLQLRPEPLRRVPPSGLYGAKDRHHHPSLPDLRHRRSIQHDQSADGRADRAACGTPQRTGGDERLQEVLAESEQNAGGARPAAVAHHQDAGRQHVGHHLDAGPARTPEGAGAEGPEEGCVSGPWTQDSHPLRGRGQLQLSKRGRTRQSNG